MSTFKKHKVVMLPTNEKAKVGMINLEPFNRDGHKLELIRYVTNGDGLNPQHLYFLSDEEIKEGDWYIHYQKGTGLRVQKAIGNNIPMDAKKIIATTSSLSVNYDLHKDSIWLPQPSQSFIEKFVDEYNKGNVITEVMVEYVSGVTIVDELQWENHETHLKVNPKDNAITIRKVKNTWDKEEVIKVCLKMQHDYLKFHRDSYYLPNAHEIAEWTDKWIEENL